MGLLVSWWALVALACPVCWFDASVCTYLLVCLVNDVVLLVDLGIDLFHYVWFLYIGSIVSTVYVEFSVCMFCY